MTQSPNRPTIIAVVNNKGGAGKTKTAEHLAWCMAEAGYSVLAVDLDGQANLTANLGATPGRFSMADVLSEARRTIGEAVTVCDPWPAGLRLAPADARLDEAASEMVVHALRINRLTTALAGVPDQIVIIDTPPNVGALVLAALMAAGHVIIPAIPVAESIAGVRRTLQLLAEMERETGSRPATLGLVATHVQPYTTLHQTGVEALEAFRHPVLGCIPHRVGQDAPAQLRAAYRPIATRVLAALGLGVKE